MKKLYIVRHAKSSWDNPDLSDFDRPLNERGLRDAPRMGKRLKEKDIHPELMLTSPAVRALTTCQTIAGILGYSANSISTDIDLYHANENTLLKIVQNISDKIQSVILFGHNPGLTDFVNALMNQHIFNVPTCGVVGCSIPVTFWKDVRWKLGNMDFYDYPKSKKD